jgi:hypothetical protein
MGDIICGDLCRDSRLCLRMGVLAEVEIGEAGRLVGGVTAEAFAGE